MPTTGFDVASFLLGYRPRKTRNLFDAETYTEQRPEWPLYVQDDFRVSNRLTLNLGLRWDVYVPWIENDNRQSNFDESTGQFVVASDNAVIDGVEVGRYLQTYSKADFAPRLGLAYDVSGEGRTIVRGGFGVFWNFTPGGTSSSKAQNPPFLQSTARRPTIRRPRCVSDGLPPPPGVDPSTPLAGGTTRSIFDINFRDAYAQQWNLNVQQQFGTQLHGRDRLRRIAGPAAWLLKGDPNQAPPVVGVTEPERQPPVHRCHPALRSVGQVQSQGHARLHALS